MRTLAQERGGNCLSDVYLHVKSKLKWECHRGHVWDAKPSGVKAGHWCPPLRDPQYQRREGRSNPAERDT